MTDTSLPNSSDQSIEVPIDSVSVGGVTPQVGDTVDFAIEARVDSVDGETCSVTPTKVNGQEVESAPEDAGEGQEEPLDQMHDRLRAMVPQDNGGY